MASSGSNMQGDTNSNIENPYRAKQLDPRVDGGQRQPGTSTSTSTTTTTTTTMSSSRQGMSSSAAPTSTSTTPSTAGAYNPSQNSGIAGNVPTAGYPSAAPSSSPAGMASGITNTANPTTRSPEYSDSARTRVPDTNTSTSASASTVPSSSYNPRTVGADRDEPGLVTKVLGAVGLGHSKKTDHTTSAVSSDSQGVGSGPPAQYRRESIPTSAYPGGPNSPAAINAPIGGTRPSQTTTTASPATGTGLGSTVVGGHEYAPARGTPGAAAQLANVAAGLSGQSKPAAAPPVGQPLTFHDLTTMPSGPGDKAPSSKDLGPGGVGAAGVGAAAVGAGVASTALPHRPHQTATTGSPIDAVAAAPGRYTQQDYDPRTASSMPAGAAIGSHHGQPPHHTGRDTALATGAGAAVAGTAAHANIDRHAEKVELHYPKKDAEKDEKHHHGKLFGIFHKDDKDDKKDRDHKEALTSVERGDKSRGHHDAAVASAATGAGAAHHARGHDHHSTTSAAATPTGGPFFTTGAAPLSQAAHTDATGHVHVEPVVTDPTQTAAAYETDSHHAKHSTAAPTAPAGAGVMAGEARGTHKPADTHTGGALLTTGASPASQAARTATTGEVHDEPQVPPSTTADVTNTQRTEPTTSTSSGSAAHTSSTPLTSTAAATPTTHHTGRNAGLGAGAGIGAAVVADNALSGRHNEPGSNVLARGQGTGTGYSTTAPTTTTTTAQHYTGRDAAIGTGAATAAGVGTSRLSSDHTARTSTDTHPSHEQKKPSILKRIFKRRKNKDTGEDEDYSTDEEDHSHHSTTAAAAGTTSHHHGHHETSVPVHHSDTKDRTVLGHAPANTTTSHHPTAHSSSHSTTHEPTDARSSIGGDGHIERRPDGRIIENITGMPYDPSKDPAAAARLQAMNRAGAVPGAALEGTGVKNVPTAEDVAGSTAGGSNIMNRGRGEGYASR